MKKSSKSEALNTGVTSGNDQEILLSQKKFRALVENNDAIIALVDKNLNTIFRSSAAARITGWAYDEFEKIAAENFIHPDDKDKARLTMAEAIANPGKTIPINTRFLHKAGHYLWLEGTVTNMLHDPDVNGIITNMHDVTERKVAEEKIHKARRLYYFISQVNQMIVRTTDEATLYKEACAIAVNLGEFRMACIGMIDEALQQVIPVMYAGGEKDALSRIKNIFLAGNLLQQGRYVICNDIEKETSMQPWKTAALNKGYHSCMSLPVKKFGKLVGAFSFYADAKDFFTEEEITLLEEATNDIVFALENLEREKMRKKAEEAVLESERRYHTLAEISPVGIFHTDETGYTTYVNPSWCRISGLCSEAALGNGWFNAVHPADRDMLSSGWQMATKISALSRSEYRFVRPDGSIRWVIGEAIPEIDAKNRIVGYVGTTTDITERKIAEEEIQKVYKEKQTVLNRINDAMISVDNEWRYTFLNDAALATHPSGREATIGEVMWDVHPEMKGTVFWDKYHEAMATGQVVEVESFYQPMNTWFAVKIYPSHDGLTIIYTDITERIKNQHEIINERNLSDSIINSLPGIFYLYDTAGKFLKWNTNFETVTKYTAAEIRQMHPLDFFDTTEKELLANKIANTFRAGEDNVQAAFVSKTKEKVPYYFTGKAIEYKGKPCLVGVGIDFTDRVKAQEKIRETTEQLRMLTAHLQNVREEERKRIGREIHDELGQQLTAIKMDVAWLDKKIPDDETIFKSKMKNIIELLDGSNKSIRRILSELRPGILDDYGLLEALEWLGIQFTENTGVHLKFTTAEKKIQSSEIIVTCIFRVYQEALTNITRYAKATKVFSSLKINDGIITVSIEDNGKGFAPESVQKHKSFGILGMQERVLSLGGEFELLSSKGNGTKIIIKLPAYVADKNLI
ncbi:MAG: PAS domain S-box protein [Ferruginibacter sp.]